jgi:hypothetical protein
MSKTSKTYSGHPCQRVLREHLWVALRLQGQAEVELSVAKSFKDKRAFKAKLAEAKKKVEIASAAVAGSEDPAVLRAAAALGRKHKNNVANQKQKLILNLNLNHHVAV